MERVNTRDVVCTICDGAVRVSCERPLTEKEVAELSARMKCTPCLKRELEGKK